MIYRFLSGLLAIILLTLAFMMHSQSAVGQGAMTMPPTPSQTLAEQAGFSSPVLDEFQRQGMRWLNENITFTAFGHDYHILSFLPVGVPTNDGNEPALGAVMLFQLDGKAGKLLWREDVGSEWSILDEKHAETTSWPAPGDWENNGQFDFAVLRVADSTCPFHVLEMYVLHSDGTVTSRFKNLIPIEQIVTSIQIQKNAPLLLTTEDERGKSMYVCVYPQITRYFELNGSKLTNISAQHQEDYMNQLGNDVYLITTWKPIPTLGDDTNAEWFSTHLMDILLIYDEIGERDAGYALMQNLASQALKEDRIKPNTYLDQIFLPDMAQLYQQGQPFIEPAYIGPKARQQYNYYE